VSLSTPEASRLNRIIRLAVLALLFVPGGFAAAQDQTERGKDQLGTIQASAVACPAVGLKATACFALDVTCPQIPDYTAYVKIIVPAHPRGTVIFTSGGDVNDTYEDAYAYGTVAVQNVVAARFTAVELTFGAPFSAGLGWEYDAGGMGVRAASCRYATIVQWVYNQTAGVPLCATGSSAGGQILGEGLAHYGLGDYLAFAEITSGPPFNRVDLGCINPGKAAVEYCSGDDIGMGVGLTNALAYVDPAYPGPWCSSSLKMHSTQYEQQFLNDSVTSPDAVLSYSNTRVRFLFGGLDTSSAIRQGLDYQSKITTPTTYGCVKDAPHSIPDVQDGAERIAADVVTNCHR
jgi:hypothetical protein